MKIKIFQKYFLIALVSLLSFVILGFFFTGFLMRQLAPKPSEFTMHPPLLFAKLIDRLNPNDKAAALKEILQMSDSFPTLRLTLISDDGAVVYPPDQKLPFDWSQIQKPLNAYEYTSFQNDEEAHPEGPSDEERGHGRGEHRPPPFLGAMGFGGPHPGGRPPMHRQSHLVRLSGEKAFYLLIEPPQMMEPPPGLKGERPPVPPPVMGFLSLLLSLVLGIAAAISMIYYSVNKNVRLADDVISQLQQGNLKARFHVKRKDEFGQAMLRFNRMADEIEKLVEHLRAVERARTKLLQELTHDLRTPIASLKSFLETLSLKSDRLDQKTKTEMVELSLSEVQYFERLVEDLLFLAQVNEPNYRSDRKPVSPEAILQDEADQITLREKYQPKEIAIETQLNSSSSLSADAHLIRRLFRNALENAVAFAQSKVQVQSRWEGHQLCITVDDDGPGFSDEALKGFGERRLSRQIQDGSQHRISVGLGSVIMKTISEAHGIELKALNCLDPQGKVKGARIEMVFKI